MTGKTTTEYAVSGDQRPQAIALTYLLAATALDAAAAQARTLHPAHHNAADQARAVARRAIQTAIDDFEGDTGEPLAGVIGRMAEAVLDAELALLDSRQTPESVAERLTTGGRIYDEIGQANV